MHEDSDLHKNRNTSARGLEVGGKTISRHGIETLHSKKGT